MDNGIDFVKIDVMNELKTKLLEKKMRKKLRKEKKKRRKERKRLRKKGIQVESSSSEDESGRNGHDTESIVDSMSTRANTTNMSSVIGSMDGDFAD